MILLMRMKKLENRKLSYILTKCVNIYFGLCIEEFWKKIWKIA